MSAARLRPLRTQCHAAQRSNSKRSSFAGISPTEKGGVGSLKTDEEHRDDHEQTCGRQTPKWPMREVERDSSLVAQRADLHRRDVQEGREDDLCQGSLPEGPFGLFNSSLEGNVRRAADFHEGDKLDEKALRALIRAAVALNIEHVFTGRSRASGLVYSSRRRFRNR